MAVWPGTSRLTSVVSVSSCAEGKPDCLPCKVLAWYSAKLSPSGDPPDWLRSTGTFTRFCVYKSRPREIRKPQEWGSLRPLKETRSRKPSGDPSFLTLTLISCSKRLCICSSCSSCLLLSWVWFRCSSFWSSRSSRSSWRLRVKGRASQWSHNSWLGTLTTGAWNGAGAWLEPGLNLTFIDRQNMNDQCIKSTYISIRKTGGAYFQKGTQNMNRHERKNKNF